LSRKLDGFTFRAADNSEDSAHFFLIYEGRSSSYRKTSPIPWQALEIHDWIFD
jgi:hypothetical protein